MAAREEYKSAQQEARGARRIKRLRDCVQTVSAEFRERREARWREHYAALQRKLERPQPPCDTAVASSVVPDFCVDHRELGTRLRDTPAARLAAKRNLRRIQLKQLAQIEIKSKRPARQRLERGVALTGAANPPPIEAGLDDVREDVLELILAAIGAESRASLRARRARTQASRGSFARRAERHACLASWLYVVLRESPSRSIDRIARKASTLTRKEMRQRYPRADGSRCDQQDFTVIAAEYIEDSDAAIIAQMRKAKTQELVDTLRAVLPRGIVDGLSRGKSIQLIAIEAFVSPAVILKRIELARQVIAADE